MLRQFVILAPAAMKQIFVQNLKKLIAPSWNSATKLIAIKVDKLKCIHYKFR